MEYKKGIPWSLVNLTIPNEKDQNPIKAFRWFISVPDGEVFYVLVIHGNVKGKFLYRYQEKKKEVLQLERHIGEEYYMSSTQIYYPFILSLAHLKSRLIYLYNIQTGLTRTAILPNDLQILGIYAYNFAIIVVCVDKIIRYPHLDDLKSDISTIPFEESFSTFVDLFDKSNMLYVESANVANEKEILTRILDLSTGKIQKTKSPPWKLSTFSVQKSFTENYYCALQQGMLYTYFKKSDLAFQMTNVTSFLLVTGNLKPKIIVGSPSGSVSVFTVTDTQSDVDFKFMGCCEPQAYINTMDLKADPNMDWKVLNMFHFKSEYIACVTNQYLFLCNISTFAVVAALEIATPERSILYDSHLYLYFEHPKTQILRIDLEASLLKLDKTQKESKKGPSGSATTPRGSPRSSPRRLGDKSAMHVITPYHTLAHPSSASNSSGRLSRDHTTTSSRDSMPPPHVPISPINIPSPNCNQPAARPRKSSVTIYSSSSPSSSSASQSSSVPERWKRSQPGSEPPQRTSLNSGGSTPRMMSITNNNGSGGGSVSGNNNTNSEKPAEQGTRSRSREELTTAVFTLSPRLQSLAVPNGVPKLDPSALVSDKVTHRHSEGNTKWTRPTGTRPGRTD